ncbi:MAG: T9SS type A sorting domain-containing protein, partial [bacterium]
TYEGYYFDDVVIGVQSGFNAVEEEVSGPPAVSSYQFNLAPAYPNPVQGRAIIAYSVGTEGPVSLKIYDLTGREITTLINQVQGPGNYRVEWDGRDSHGTMVSSGTYFYRMTAGNFSDGKKLVVVR